MHFFAVIASVAKQPIFLAATGKDGLLRYARNDGVFRPGVSEHRTGLKAVKDAARRLRRWAAPILDRFSPRAILNTAGTEKRPVQPNRETTRMDNTMKWQMLPTSFLLIFALAGRGVCQTLPPEVKADPSISQLVPLELHSGSNDVVFWGTRKAAGPDVPFHQAGKIYEFETGGVTRTYYATMQWETPSYLLPLEDAGPPPGDSDDSAGGNYVGNMDIFTSVPIKSSNIPANILLQHIAFFQGLLNGKNQTFFVLAHMQNTADLAAWYKSRPVGIDIYAFSGGDEPPDFANPPGFEPVDSFTTKYNYCDAEYALLAVLPIVPPPLKQLHDLQTLAKPSLQKQLCRD